jgi:hypothetical protein
LGITIWGNLRSSNFGANEAAEMPTFEVFWVYNHMKWVIFFCLLFSIVEAASLRIVNNSPYPLTASIYSVKNEYLGALLIDSRHEGSWRDSYHGASDWTKGPYKVVFTCPNGSEYGVVKKVNDGFTVYARRATGSRRCS